MGSPRRSIVQLRRVLSVAALGALALAWTHALPADAAPAWDPPVRISKSGGSASEVAVAIGASGEVVAVWQFTDDKGLAIQSASRLPGGAWSAPVELARLGDSAASRARPKIAIGAAGEAVAVWVLGSGGSRAIQSASRPSGGVWSPSATLSPGSAGAAHPEIAIDGVGEAVAVWETTPVAGGKSTIDSASRPAGSSWSAPAPIAPLGASRPQIAINAAGEAVAVWEREGGRRVVQAAARPPGGSWSAPATLSRKRDRVSANPEIAIDDAGEALAVWEGGADIDSTFVRSAWRPLGGGWSSPSGVSTGRPAHHPFPRLAVNSAGEATVVWAGSEGYGPTVMGASRLPGGGWAPPKRIDRGPQVIFGPGVGIDAAGKALVAWGGASFGRKGEIDTLLGASRPPGAAWAAPRPIADLGRGGEELPEVGGVDGLAEIAVNASGQAVVAWEQNRRGRSPLFVKAAVLP